MTEPDRIDQIQRFLGTGPYAKTQARAGVTSRTLPVDPDHPYLRAALDAEVDKVAAAAEGTRNAALNEAAFSLGTLVAAGLDEQTVRTELADAATAAGLDSREIDRTLASGLGAGLAEPRAIPDDGPRAGLRVIRTAPRPRVDVPWPVLPDAALHGIIGEFVRAAAPHTEGDIAGILVSSLVCLGGAIGGGPHMMAGNEKHGVNLFAVLIGGTSKARKGTATAAGRALAARVDPVFAATRLAGGFGSGEALVDEVRDSDPDKDDDAGASDKRLVVDEPEFARLLKVAGRDGSILGSIIRHAWDGRPLEARARSRKAVATGAHVAAICQITAEELRARLTDTETYGGTANRFLFAATRRSGLHSNGGNVPEAVLAEYGQQLGQVVRAARRVSVMHRTEAAQQVWHDLYVQLAEDDPGGLLGAVIARDAPQCLRLSILYALLDGATQVDAPHVNAAGALWSYCRATAAHVFGDKLGDDTADRLIIALRDAGSGGLSRDQQLAALGRHVSAARLDVAADRLTRLGLSTVVTEQTGGRPRQVLRACEESERSEKRSDTL